MFAPTTYSAMEQLPNGAQVEIRALRPDDRAELIAAVDRASSQSLYRRFFGAKRSFTEKEIDFFLNVDFVSHVALVAVLDEGGRSAIVGGGRYIVLQPGTAEVAFVVIDQRQGQGIGGALMKHLAAIARQAGLKEFVAEVLPRTSRCSGSSIKVDRASAKSLKPGSCISSCSWSERDTKGDPPRCLFGSFLCSTWAAVSHVACCCRESRSGPNVPTGPCRRPSAR